jgi:hypothetical protein
MREIEAITAGEVAGVKYILHDIDDTITNDGKLLPESYAALWALSRAGYKVIPVTGRPAGWCDMILRQWPVAAVVGENGAFVDYFDGADKKRFFHPAVPRERLSEKLDEIRDACLRGVPGCRVSQDQHYRLCDLAIDFNEDVHLGLEAAEQIKAICEAHGAIAKISSIHVNTWFGDYSKVEMAQLFLQTVWGEDRLEEKVIFFGDSPNDEPMFAHFPLSVGVANIRPFADSLRHLPTFVTRQEGGKGFAEAVGRLLAITGK